MRMQGFDIQDFTGNWTWLNEPKQWNLSEDKKVLSGIIILNYFNKQCL